MDPKKNLEEFLARVEKVKASGGIDLSAAEDLSIAVMNLISLEEHFFFTGAKTGDGKYHDLTSEVREMRKRLLADLVPVHEGETWCASKHLLAASMRLIEVGNRYQKEKDKTRAQGYFADAYRLFTIFFALKSKLISASALGATAASGGKEGWSFETLMSKLADCCKE